MTAIQCEASGCKRKGGYGYIFFQCDHCRRWWCSHHGSEGKSARHAAKDTSTVHEIIDDNHATL